MKQNLKRDKHRRYVYIYSKNSSVYKYTHQRIHSTQKCLIQHAYTKTFSYIICFKGKVHTKDFKKIYSGCSAHGKGYMHYST